MAHDVVSAIDGLKRVLQEQGVLPAVNSDDEGKVLMVNAEGKWVAEAIPSQLPTVAAPADVGKVLTVGEDGTWGAATPEISAET